MTEPQDNRTPKKWIQTVNEWVATMMLFVCFVLLVATFVCGFCYIRSHHPETTEVHFVIETDSVGNVTPATRAMADSLMLVVERHEHALQDKYEYILDQKQTFNDLLTLGGLFLTVVLSVFGFFGYKSLRSIEERATLEAKNAAVNKAEHVTRKRFEQYCEDTTTSLQSQLETKVSSAVSNAVELKSATLKRTLSNTLNKQVKDKFNQKYSTTIEPRVTEIAAHGQSISLIQNQIAKLVDRIETLESTRSIEIRRRTLASTRANVVQGLTLQSDPSQKGGDRK